MKKIYSLFTLLVCLLFAGNIMAEDVMLPVNGQYYKIKNVDPAAGSKGAGKYITNKPITQTQATLQETGDVFLATVTTTTEGEGEAQVTKTFAVFQNILSGKYLSYTGHNPNYGMAWVDDNTIEGVRYEIRDGGDHARIVCDNNKGWLFWDPYDPEVGVFNNQTSARDNPGKWAFEVAVNADVQVKITEKIAEAEAVLAQEGIFGDAEKAALQTAIADAKAFDTEGATFEAMVAVINNLQAVIVAYEASQIIPEIGIEEGVEYRIICADLSLGYMYADSKKNCSFKTGLSDDQLFVFEEVEGKGYKIKPLAYPDSSVYVRGTSGYDAVSFGKKDGDGGSGEKWSEENSTFAVEYAGTINGVNYFYFVAKGNYYLYYGRENTVRTQATPNTTPLGRFAIIPAGEVSKVILTSIINQATNMLSTTEEGSATGQYLPADREALTAAIAAAQAICDDDEVTQEQVDQAVVDLSAAIDIYKLAVMADRTALTAKIAEANDVLATTEEGKKPGQYLPETRAELTAAIAAAQTALEAETLTQVAADEAVATLQEAINVYYNSKVSWVKSNRVYYIVSRGEGRYVGRAEENTATTLTLRGSADATAYPVVFVPTESANIYNVKRYEQDEYLTFNDYNTYFKPLEANADMRLSEVDETYIQLQFVKNKYFGSDGQGVGDGIWANKDGKNQNNHQWKPVENKKMSLAYFLSQVEGYVEADYTAATWTPFQTALTAAKGLAEDATDEQIETAIVALEEAVDALVNISGLKTLIAFVGEMVEADYTAATWGALQTELTAANAALETADTQTAVDEASAALQAAIDALVNISELNALITSAEAFNQADYAAISWDALQAALPEAKNVLQSATTQDEVDTAIATLSTVITDMISLKELREQIADIEASGFVESDYSVASWKALSDALAAAEAVMTTAETKQDVDNARSTLMAAVTGLVNVKDLKTTIESGKDFVESDYTTTSWTAYTTALGTANAAVETAVSESTVVSAKSALDTAIKGLVNVKDLRALVTTAKEKKEADYTAESWSAFKSALNAAESALETAANQAAVDVAKVALQKAMDDLALKTGIEALQSAGIDMYVSGQTLYVTGLSNQVVISGYDVSGRMIFTEQVSEATFTRELPAGNYVIAIKGYVNGSALVISK